MPTLACVPPVTGAERVAERVLAEVGPRLAPAAGPLALRLVGLGLRVEEDDLGASVGGHQAMLVPAPGGGFVLLVDPELTPQERASRADLVAVHETRLLHELGHALFYAPGAPPRRVVPAAGHEEEFCDAFASALGRRLAGTEAVTG